MADALSRVARSLRPPRVIVAGPPGSGKSTVAPRAAARLGWESVDLDALVEARAGCTIPSLISARGEAAFRALERSVLEGLLSRDRVVIAAGGGSLVDAGLRRRALRDALVVGLEVPDAELLARVGDGRGRPLLQGDPAGALRALRAARGEGYAEVTRALDGTADPDAIAGAVAAIAEGRRPRVVPLGSRTYRVEVAPGTRPAQALGDALGEASGALIITDRRVLRCQSEMVGAVARRFGAPVLAVPPGERSKSPWWLQKVWSDAVRLGLDRGAAVLCVGGGVVSDLGGFAAATLYRGVRFATVPTTLLSMVDASVGGKTAVDLPEGKNLVGVFHQPSSVVCPLGSLGTLAGVEWRSGLGELAKTALVADPLLVELLEAHAPALRAGVGGLDPEVLEAAVARAVQAKIDVVAEDEREQGPRAALNFGHTLGHAIEIASGCALRHGCCVAVGMIAALEVGERAGVTPPAVRARAEALLGALGLPRTARVAPGPVLAAAGFDKKRARGGPRMVLLAREGEAALHPVSPAELRGAAERVLEIR